LHQCAQAAKLITCRPARIFQVELIVFDLDGTLLNQDSAISDYTSETLKLLAEQEIAYTVATGRTLHSARAILEGHQFLLPQAYKNGVMIWHPEQSRFSSGAMLTAGELDHIVQACIRQRVTPFVFTLAQHQQNTVYHPPLQSEVEQRLIDNLGIGDTFRAGALDELPEDAAITHINSIGESEAIKAVLRSINDEPHLVAYSGTAWEGRQWRWLDIHHSDASKGGAIQEMKQLLGIERVICFGDNDNDLSMFEVADESYAPENANDAIKSAATAVIGHHDEEGIARFLRERFALKPN
jgi:Cof subfamily protein (haloacid dehalogenase superfamily)